MSETVVSLKNISKHYWLSFAKQSLIGSFLSIFRVKSPNEAKREICALENIQLSVKQGETVGIIGENASGKTTMLRIISRITVPTKGQLQIKGKVAGLLDLGAGFHSELTGQENIYLDAALYGMSRKEIEEVYEKIVDFSGLGEFINAQVKTYSQGMLVRLGFAIAIHVNPDIFLIDDSLAVGDEEFQRKCLNKVFELKEQGKTIIVVSHDLDSISRICERGILLKSGQIVKDDSMYKVIVRYIEAVGDKKSIASFDKGRISVIFNNGKIILLWDGKPVTKNFGGYASLQILDKWVMSWQAKWQVLENTHSSWKVIGLLDKYGIKIEFECLLEKENKMSLKCKMHIPKKTGLKKAGFGFMVSEKYDSGFWKQKIEPIDQIDEANKEWTDIYRTDEYDASIILMNSEGMPALKMNFVNQDHSGFSLIQNTTKELSARILQTQISLPADSDLLKSDDSIIESRCAFELLSEAEVQSFIKKRIQSESIESGKIKVQLKDKAMQVFYKGTELTNSEGLSVGFYHSSRFFDLFDGSWNLNKECSNSLSICSEFKEMGLKVNLLIKLSEKDLSWEMDIADEKSMDRSRLVMRFYLSQNFKKYFFSEKEYEFAGPGEYAEKINLPEGQTDFIGLSNANETMPFLVFEASQKGGLQLQNNSIDSPGRILMQENSESSINGKIILLDTLKHKNEYVFKKNDKQNMRNMLCDDQLRIELKENNIIILKGEHRITAGEGFSSGVFFNGRWNESTQLKKQIDKEGETLKVSIERRLPALLEVWEISLKDGDINWTTKVQCEEEVDVFQYKAGLVLNPDYRHWVHSFDEGQFDKQSEDNNCVDLDDINNAMLGAKSKDNSLPAVFFKRINNNTSGVIIRKQDDNCWLQFKLNDEKSKNKIELREIFSGFISVRDNDRGSEYVLNHRKEDFMLETDDGLQLFAKTQEIKLQALGKELTQKKGLTTSFVWGGDDIDTYFANWTLKKTSANSIEVQMDWRDDILKEKYRFELIDNAIEWTISLDIKQPVFMKKFLLNVFIPDRFNQWQAREDHGQILCRDELGKATVFSNDKCDKLRIFQNKATPKNPGLAIDSLSNMNNRFLHIYNHARGDGVSCGYYVFDPKGVYLDKGVSEIFKVKLFLVKE